jgi:hypothetical protein
MSDSYVAYDCNILSPIIMMFYCYIHAVSNPSRKSDHHLQDVRILSAIIVPGKYHNYMMINHKTMRKPLIIFVSL